MRQINFTKKPPVAKEVSLEMEIHGDTRIDNYRWMQDRDAPAVMNYINEENDYLESVMEKSKDLVDNLYGEMRSRICETYETAPVRDGEYSYYSRYEEGLSYPIYCRKSDRGEEILLDQNKLIGDNKFCALGSFKISPDSKMLMYSVDFNGDEVFEIRIKKLDEGYELDDIIKDASANCEWANDGKSFFYVVCDETRRPYRLFNHVLGTLQERDTVLFTEENQLFFFDVEKSASKKYLFLMSGSHDSSFARYISLEDPSMEVVPLTDYKKGVLVAPAHREGYFYFHTNENALDFKVTISKESSPQDQSDFIPHQKGVMIEEILAFEDFLVVRQSRNGAFELFAVDGTAKKIADIPLEDRYSEPNLYGNRMFKTNILRYSYESFITPYTSYDYNIITKENKLIKQKKVPNYDSSLYESKRLYAPSKDGMEIPISIFYKKDMLRKGENPFFLIGYGSYGYSYYPAFQSNLLSLVDRGFICGIAHIRGGCELGRDWYLSAKFLQKKNTFFDFIACSEYLIKENWSAKDKLCISGRSAGGLLMGAVTTMRPELFALTVAEVPFVDSLNTMLDETLPLTIGEYEEWGNPNKKEFYEYMKSYAPYENIKETEYPPMFFFTALNDTRVMYWEPLKFVAKLRKFKTDDNVIVLQTDCHSGHRGASGRYDLIKEKALQYAFILKTVGIC